MAVNNIVVLGYGISAVPLFVGLNANCHTARAGVSGLTTAYLLSKDASNSITVLAKHMPGDYDIEYCSPWAGANYMPYVFQFTTPDTYFLYLLFFYHVLIECPGSAKQDLMLRIGRRLLGLF